MIRRGGSTRWETAHMRIRSPTRSQKKMGPVLLAGPKVAIEIVENPGGEVMFRVVGHVNAEHHRSQFACRMPSHPAWRAARCEANLPLRRLFSHKAIVIPAQLVCCAAGLSHSMLLQYTPPA